MQDIYISFIINTNYLQLLNINYICRRLVDVQNWFKLEF